MQRFKRDETVYNWHYDHFTTELSCSEITIEYYEYLDGMQWEVVDTYVCSRKFFVPYFKYFKKEESETFRLPGHLIHTDRIVAQIIVLNTMVMHFGYILELNGYSSSDNLKGVVRDATNRLEKLYEKYPEKILQAQVEVLAKDNNSGYLWR